jgi:hypothetical protein
MVFRLDRCCLDSSFTPQKRGIRIEKQRGTDTATTREAEYEAEPGDGAGVVSGMVAGMAAGEIGSN